MVKLLKSILKLALGLIIMIVAYIGINEGMAAYIRHSVQEDYFTTSVNYIYVEDRENEKLVVDTIEGVLNKYPADLVKEFKSSWVVVISTQPPEELKKAMTMAADKVSGLNLGTAKTIWASSYMTDQLEEIFAHEFGHFVAFELGGIDYSEKFVKLYEENKEDFIQFGKKEPDEYNVSSSNEFFATLCEQYIRHPDYLKENYKGCYDYVTEALNKNHYEGFLSGYKNEFVSTIHIAISQIQKNRL